MHCLYGGPGLGSRNGECGIKKLWVHEGAFMIFSEIGILKKLSSGGLGRRNIGMQGWRGAEKAEAVGCEGSRSHEKRFVS